jgi:hypothetical protein
VPDDPFELRRRGTRRVRVVTASLAAVAAAGTGAVVLAVSSAGTAQAGSGTGVQDPTGTDGQDGGFSTPGQAPAQAPGGVSGGGRDDASSGGS